MKEFWIIKKAPEEGLVKDGPCTAYSTEEAAVEKARSYATSGGTFVVLKAVRAFKRSDILELPIEEA